MTTLSSQRAARFLVGAVALTLVGCAYIGGDAPGRQQAEAVLQNWADFMADTPHDAIVFVHDLTQGGGWDESNADDAKSAFLTGLIDAAVKLPGQEPPPGEVVWTEGTRQQVSLVSAATAFEEMVAELSESGGSCEGCRPLQVIGAELTTRTATTSHGDASVPVWQFDFAPGDRPMTPISYVAVKDRIGPQDWHAWGDHAPFTMAAYGTAEDSEITVAFTGGACDTSHSIEAAESILGIVPIIVTVARPGPCIAVGVGYALAMQLDAPLGNRAVLDIDSGFPVPVYPEEPSAPGSG